MKIKIFLFYVCVSCTLSVWGNESEQQNEKAALLYKISEILSSLESAYTYHLSDENIITLAQATERFRDELVKALNEEITVDCFNPEFLKKLNDPQYIQECGDQLIELLKTIQR